MYGFHLELAFRQRAGLVEHHYTGLCQRVHIVGALDENTPSGCSADAGEERERNADYQCTRTRNHEESQCTVYPYGQGAEIVVG